MISSQPSRGEVWEVNLNPVQGHEQAGLRPCLVVSDDTFNHGPAGLVVIVPITSRDRGIPLHVRVSPPDGGLTMLSFVKCEDIRSVSKERFRSRRGAVSLQAMKAVEDRLRILLNLSVV